jgi:hypothetical protein
MVRITSILSPKEGYVFLHKEKKLFGHKIYNTETTKYRYSDFIEVTEEELQEILKKWELEKNEN